MNVAIVVYAYYSRDARVRRYAESLAAEGHKIDCICLSENYKPHEKNISLIGYPFQRQRFGRFWYFIEYLSFFIFTTCVLSVNSLIKKYSLVHINNMPETLVFTAFIPKLFGTNVLLDIHDLMPELYMSKYYKKEDDFSIRLLRLFENFSLKFADHVITANTLFKHLLLRRNNCMKKNKLTVILNCPDPNIFKPGPQVKKKSFNLFYMGTVEERFALNIVLDSFPILVKHIPSIKFILIPKLTNEGTYFKTLLQQITTNNLSDHVSIQVPQPLEKIAQLLQQADLGIVLAKKDVFTEIIFPVKLLEFVQMNIPVIAVKTKLLKQNFTDKQIMFLRDVSPRSFTNSVLKLYKEWRLRKKLAANAKKYLVEYNWNKEKIKYLSIIYSLAKK